MPGINDLYINQGQARGLGSSSGTLPGAIKKLNIFLLGMEKYRVSHITGISNFGIQILCDGRGYGIQILRKVRYVYWV